MKENKDLRKLRFERIPALFSQLISDIKPVPERLNIKVNIRVVNKKRIEKFCKKNNDLNILRKMMSHELVKEPAEKVIVISRQNKKKIRKKYFNKLLEDLGYNVNVLLSKSHEADYEAAINIGGYSIPGWAKFVKLLRKFNNNIAVFFGKRFAPGKSRLHVRIWQGEKHWYLIAHIDKYNYVFNIKQIGRSHIGSGAGDYKRGNKYFLDSLKYYFGKNQKTL